jgi:pyroglutamyl-peptidase
MKRVLLTGFDPFGQWASNPSWDALVRSEQLGLLAGLDARIARIPVTWEGAFEAFAFAARDCQPELAISFGLHNRDDAVICVETTARNRDGAPKPDNAGIQRAAMPIDKEGPETLQSGLPVAAILDALSREGMDAEESSDAGAYLCNHVFYRGALEFGGQFPYGFVHVPPVESLGGVLTLERLAQAVALIAHTAASADGV